MKPIRLLLKSITLTSALCFVLLTNACQTTKGTGDATNQVIASATKVLGAAAVRALYDASTGTNQDYAQSVASGLWKSIGSATTASAVQAVVTAYGGNKAPALAALVPSIFKAASGTNADKLNALAAVISAATGAPPK